MDSSPGQIVIVRECISGVDQLTAAGGRYVSYKSGLLSASTHLDADKNLVQVTVQVRRQDLSNVLKNVLGNFILL